MAQVKVEEIVEHLKTEFRRALAEAVENTIEEDIEFDDSDLYRAFKRSIDRRTSTWEKVPDKYVKQ